MMEMKKIGREVAFLKTGESNPRNGEGSFVRLRDGSILHAYTEYYGESGEDNATARIACIRSEDEGESWSSPKLLLEKDESAQNYMSVSLIRLPSGELGMFFLRKAILSSVASSNGEEVLCMPVFCTSVDEGESWSDPVFCIERLGYYCGINDGILLQRNGRLVMAMSSDPEAVIYIVASEDCGRSWYTLGAPITLPFSEFPSGLEEPGLYEHESGELWLYCRTFLGYQYQSRSADNGKTWSSVIPNLYFSSPDAPMRVKRIGEYTVAAFNPSACHCLSPSNARRPLVCAVCRDDGASFQNFTDFTTSAKMKKFSQGLFAVENDPANTYCYPSMIEVKGGFLIAYYHSEGDAFPLRATKITKILFDEIEG